VANKLLPYDTFKRLIDAGVWTLYITGLDSIAPHQHNVDTIMSVDLNEATAGDDDAITPGLKRRGMNRSESNGSSYRASKSTHMSLKNVMLSMDIETGKAGSRIWLVEEIYIRREAMNPRARRRAEYLDRFGCGTWDEKDEASVLSPPQYRLRTMKNFGKFSFLQILSHLTAGSDNNPTSDKTSAITLFLNWTFRTSFTMLILVQSINFWVFTSMWAFLIMIVGNFEPKCITVGTQAYTGHFLDAFALSWTTFSTVGYGIVYPTLSVGEGPNCFGVNVMMSIEAFMGVLFAAVMGAIFFGKVCRIQSHANISFSDPLLVRFGTGLLDALDEDEDWTNPVEGKKKGKPCPVLEFRIINSMHSTVGGEIMNAYINCTASINESNAKFGLPKHRPTRRKHSRKGATRWSKKSSSAPELAQNLALKAIKNVASAPQTAFSTMKDGAEKFATKTGLNKMMAQKDKEAETTRIDDAIDAENPSYSNFSPDKSDDDVDGYQESTTMTVNSDSIVRGDSEMDDVVAPPSSVSTFSTGDDTQPSINRGPPSSRSFVSQSKETKVGSVRHIKKTFLAAAKAMHGVGGLIRNQSGSQLTHEFGSCDSDAIFSDDDDYDDVDDDDDDNGKEKMRCSVVDEGAGLATPRFFAPLELETPSHPFFKRVWVVRHTLNEESPLLSGHVRTLISENNGNWPEELNNHEKIRENIDFHEIIVSFSGTGNATGSAVYQQTMYTLEDMAVGYTFANVLEQNENGVLQVADDRINDVMEQNGGGGESLGASNA